jgi:hypothetical protein
MLGAFIDAMVEQKSWSSWLLNPPGGDLIKDRCAYLDTPSVPD